MPDFHRTYVDDNSFIRGAARIMWCGTTIALPTTLASIINLSTYDAQTNWNELGATKTGIQITMHNSEEAFDVDQILGDIRSQPTNWEMAVQTNLAEMTLERLQIAWEGSGVTTDAGVTPNEKQIGFGQPTAYVQRRLAVLFQRPNNKIRGYLFRIAQRSPQDSTVVHNKTGEQITIPMRWKILADPSVNDVYSRFMIIRDQQ